LIRRGLSRFGTLAPVRVTYSQGLCRPHRFGSGTAENVVSKLFMNFA
jgi:hypothetical protein